MYTDSENQFVNKAIVCFFLSFSATLVSLSFTFQFCLAFFIISDSRELCGTRLREDKYDGTRCRIRLRTRGLRTNITGGASRYVTGDWYLCHISNDVSVIPNVSLT